VVVGKLGTATASIDEIREAMNTHAPIAHGLLDADAALAACQRPRRRRAHRGAAGALGSA
jgi:D-beta-D-heptose 7-phosphate kinase/D-beta-D-heptose 1-phosphate adenosyltransferase